MTDRSSAISRNLNEILQRVRDASLKSGRDETACELLVVSKTWPAESLAEVAAAGHLSFGENKVQEAEWKVPALQKITTQNFQWHLIGHLQRNKVRKALPLFGTIHSIDSLKLARSISKTACELKLKPDIYLQVDLAGEITKNGYAPEELRRDLDELFLFEGFHIKGLMCIPPAAKSPEDARPWFVRLRELRDELEVSAGVSLPGLSMGMSGDFEVAIEEGATIVRVGSSIFGSRNY
ncbi:MAG: YggS family pyridoxal phosphate-dependent enzyme [Akkermansiaceae bacterium]